MKGNIFLRELLLKTVNSELEATSTDAPIILEEKKIQKFEYEHHVLYREQRDNNTKETPYLMCNKIIQVVQSQTLEYKNSSKTHQAFTNRSVGIAGQKSYKNDI